MNEDYSEIKKKWKLTQKGKKQKQNKQKKTLPLIRIKGNKFRNSCKINRNIFPLRSYCCCCCGGGGGASVVSDSMRPHRRPPTRLLCPWDSTGKNTGVGCHFLLQCMKVKSESEVAQSCPTLSDLMDCSLPGSCVHGIFQARILEWGAIAYRSCELP